MRVFNAIERSNISLLLFSLGLHLLATGCQSAPPSTDSGCDSGDTSPCTDDTSRRDTSTTDTAPEYPDKDGDGYTADVDCDDGDPAVYPGLDQDGDGYDVCFPDCDDTDPTVLSVCLAVVEAGSFVMGSPETEVGRWIDETQHMVTLTRNFYVGIWEITQEQFEHFAGYQPSYFAGCPTCPVETINWHEAAALTNAISEAAHLDRCYQCVGSGSSSECSPDPSFATIYDCPGYRLPTEAEWEYAARAGETAAFSNGGSLSIGTENDCGGALELDNGALLDDVAWYCGNSEGSTRPVAQLAPNAWGLFDTNGSVWEWVDDWYDLYAGDEVDPVGPSSGYLKSKRSGSWNFDPYYSRFAIRDSYNPTASYYYTGVRVARTVP